MIRETSPRVKNLLQILLVSCLIFSSSAFAQSATINASLSWIDNSNNEDGFTIERAPIQTGTFTVLGKTAANITTYIDPNLLPATQYCYRVKAYNTVGDSGYSNIACLTTPSIPATPGNVTVTVTLTP